MGMLITENWYLSNSFIYSFILPTDAVFTEPILCARHRTGCLEHMTTMALAHLELHLDICSGTSRAGLPQAGLSWEEVNWRVMSIEKRGRRKGNSLASHCGASRMQVLPRLLKGRFLEPSYQCSHRGLLSDKHLPGRGC